VRLTDEVVGRARLVLGRVWDGLKWLEENGEPAPVKWTATVEYQRVHGRDEMIVVCVGQQTTAVILTLAHLHTYTYTDTHTHIHSPDCVSIARRCNKLTLILTLILTLNPRTKLGLRVSKNVPSLSCYNFDVHEWILTFFGRNVTDRVGNQRTLYYATSNNLCFCTT